MSIPSNKVQLDFTPKSLFPKLEADKDPKCVIVAEVIQQLAKRCDLSEMTQEKIQSIAESRYNELSLADKLTLPQADHKAFSLYQKGVDHLTAQKYYSHRLTEADAKKWKIVLI